MNIYINDGSEIPTDETCYIIAKGGIYLKKKLDLIESLTPVDKISFLEDLPVFARLDIPKISAKMFGNIISFFREVYKLYRSEAVVLIFYSKDKKSYKVFVPDQEVSGASLSYEATKTIKGFQLIGTIHSHANMSAFHSGVDVNDEKSFDGIHMTLGKMGLPDTFDLCGCIVVNGMRVPINPEDYVDGLDYVEYTNYFPQMFRPAFKEVDGEKVYKNTVKSSFAYSLNPSGEDISDFNKDWLTKVKEKVYTYSNINTGFGGKYTWKDGKLIRLDEPDKNVSQLTFDFEPYKPTKCKNPCETCIYRDEKLELKNLKKVKDADELTYNKISEDYSYFNCYDGYGDYL